MIGHRELYDDAQRHPYVTSATMVLIVTALGFLADPVLRAANLDMVYLLAVFLSAIFCGERPAVFTAIVGAILFDYCFVPPRFSWATTDLAYVVTLLVFVAIGIVTARGAAQARQRMRDHAARERAEALSASKDELLHRISHELRSPMTAVLGWTQLIRAVNLEGAELDAARNGLENSAQLLRRLIDDLLDASRAASGKLLVRLQPMMLGPAIIRALDVVSVAAKEKNVRIVRSIDDVGVLADETRIEQVVANLVANAIKFTPPAGTVTVSLSRAVAEARICVNDTGCGIATDFLPHVFEPFSQADPGNAHGGLGLGLSIVKYLVEAHGGTIVVKSDGLGRGSTFIINLPALENHRSANIGTAA